MVLHSEYVVNLGGGAGHFLSIFWRSVFSFYINLISSSFVKGFLMCLFDLNWNQGFLGHPCLVRASKCLHRSYVRFGFNALTVVFKTTSRSTFPYWESQKLQVPGLSDSKCILTEGTHGHVRTQQWNRQWVWVDHSTSHLAALDLWLLHSSCRGPQDPADFWKCHLPGPRWRAETQLCILIHRKICRIFFSCHMEVGFIFQPKVFTNKKPGIKLSYDMNPEVYWWKGQGTQKSISTTEHLELLMI